ncbi:MAG: hypothetical protein ABIJ96_13375 [Elusimicrobiota bacterium]
MRALCALLAAALFASGCAVRARRTTQKLFEDCDYRGLSREECHHELGCPPENSRAECEQSLRHRMKFLTGEG